MQTFNTAGPSVPGQHYMIEPLKRIEIEEIELLIDQHRYFVLHAPRQTGKTTSLLGLSLSKKETIWHGTSVPTTLLDQERL